MFGVAVTPANLSHLATLGNCNLLRRLVVLVSSHILNLPHNVHAIDDLAEHNVLVVQVWQRNSRDEELGAIGVGARVLYSLSIFCHVQAPCA